MVKAWRFPQLSTPDKAGLKAQQKEKSDLKAGAFESGIYGERYS